MFQVIQGKYLCPMFKGYDYVFAQVTRLFLLTLASADVVNSCNMSSATG